MQVFFLKKLTNWSSHKLENSLEWSITSNQQANFINFNPIEQNPQIGFKTNPRIFNCSQNPKLIKLTNIYHEYINIEAKPNDQFQKKKDWFNKNLNFEKFQKFLKNAWVYAWKHENKSKRKGIKVLLALWEKNIAKIWLKTTKNLHWSIAKSERERKVWKSFEKVFWISQNTV